MAFADADTAFQKQITIFRTATTRGFKLLSLTVTDPNAAGVPVTNCTIAMGTDSSLWKSDAGATAWVLVTSGSGGDIVPDDVSITFGDDPLASGNMPVLMDSAGTRTFKIVGTALSAATAVVTDTPAIVIGVVLIALVAAAVLFIGGRLRRPADDTTGPGLPTMPCRV